MIGKLNPKIVAACTVGLLMVGGAFWLSPAHGPKQPDPRLEVVAGAAPERNFIEVSDSDGDGIADWKRTIPERPEWLKSASSTNATTTKTHTETVAVEMLERLLRSNINGGFGDTPEEIINRSSMYVERLATDKLFTARDIVIRDDSSTAALRAYGNRVAEITFANAVNKVIDDEVMILDRVVASQDATELADIALIAESYRGITEDLLNAPVPRELMGEHLDLINTVHALATDIDSFTYVFSDPLYTLVRIRRYEEDALGLYQAISNLYLKIHTRGVTWTEADAASKFIKIE